MNTSLLKTIKLKIPKETRDLNISNGNDAEVYGASMLLKAIGAEVSWGSRNEDGRKIDLICSYDHPWIEKERIIFLVQVKSGPTYGIKSANGFKLLSVAKKSAIRTSHPICIIWIDRATNSSFWAYIHPFSTISNQDYGNNHKIEPAMRFDIARCQAKSIPAKIGGKGIIIKELIEDLKSNRKIAINSYNELKTNLIINPNLGKIEITRIAWRHMFRKSRSPIYKSKSLNIIPYLNKILIDKPSEIYITKTSFFEQSNYCYRNIEYVLKYEEVKLYNKTSKTAEKTSVIVRLIEEIRWSKDWKDDSMLTQNIERRVVLLSSYYK